MGLAFRGHDEFEGSSNRGNFIELVKTISSLNQDIKKVMLKKFSGNLQLTAPSIQKEIVSCVALETHKAIFEELGNDLFGIRVDDAADVSYKEQMGIILCYVNKKGHSCGKFYWNCAC